MEKIYKNLNVYEALQKRFEFIFSEFDNIYVSFSGGKDSGVLLNCLLKYKDEHGITLPIGVFHQDYEAQFQHTTDYVTKTFDKLSVRKDIHLYYMCLPFAVKTSLSNYDLWWYPWDENKKDLWIREQPKRDYVISIDNNIFDWYTLNMQEEDIFNKFTKWYGKQYNGGKTLCLLGLRANESLRRYNAISGLVLTLRIVIVHRRCMTGLLKIYGRQTRNSDSNIITCMTSIIKQVYHSAKCA